MASTFTEPTRSTEGEMTGGESESSNQATSSRSADNRTPPQPTPTPSAQQLQTDALPSGGGGVADPDLLKKLRKQVEFYFGSHNLARDGYLRSLLYAQSFVAAPVTAIATFRKVRELCASARGPALDTTADPSLLIAAALEGSSVVAVSPDGLWLCPLHEIPPYSQPNMLQRPAVHMEYPYGSIPPPHTTRNAVTPHFQQVIDSGQKNMRPSATGTTSGDTVSTASVRSNSTPLSRSGTPVGSHPSGGAMKEQKELSTVILRDIPSECDPELVIEAFTTSSVRPLSARGEADDTWHVVFSSETEAREGVFASVNRLIDGRKVRARIKGGAAGAPPPSSDSSVASTHSFRETSNHQMHVPYSSRVGAGNVPAFVSHASMSTIPSNQIPSVVGRGGASAPDGIGLVEAATSTVPLPQVPGHLPVQGVAPSLFPPQHAVPFYHPVAHQHPHHRHAPQPHQGIPGQIPIGYVPSYQPHVFPPHQFAAGAAFPVPYGAAPFPVHPFPGNEMAGMFGSVHVMPPHNPFGRHSSDVGSTARGGMRDDGRGWRSGQQRQQNEVGVGKRTRKNKGVRTSVPFGGDSEDNDIGHPHHSNVPQHHSSQPHQYQYRAPVGQRLGANWRRQGSVSSVASTSSAPEFGDSQSFVNTEFVSGGENPYPKSGAPRQPHGRSFQGGIPDDRDRLVHEVAGGNSRHSFPYGSQQKDQDVEADRVSVTDSDQGGGEAKAVNGGQDHGKKKGKRKSKRDGNNPLHQQSGAPRTEDGCKDSTNNTAATSGTYSSSSLGGVEAHKELLTIDNFPALGVVVAQSASTRCMEEDTTETNENQQTRSADVPLSGYAAALLKPKPIAVASEAAVISSPEEAAADAEDATQQGLESPAEEIVVTEVTDKMDQMEISLAESTGVEKQEARSETQSEVRSAGMTTCEASEPHCDVEIEKDSSDPSGKIDATGDDESTGNEDHLVPELTSYNEKVEVVHEPSGEFCDAPREGEEDRLDVTSTSPNLLVAVSVPESSSSVTIAMDPETPSSAAPVSLGGISTNGDFSRAATASASAWTTKRTFADVVLKQASQST